MTFYNRKDMLYVRINGKRISTKLRDTPKNRKKALSYYKDDEFLDKFNLQNNKHTVLEMVDLVMIDKEESLKATSFRTYLSLYNSRIVPYFKNILISEVTPKFVSIWYKTFTDKRTIITCEAMLKSAFEKAIIFGYIKTSPFVIKKPSLKSTYKINPFTYDELKQIFEYKEDDLIVNFVAISCFTGLRTGELCALEWKNVNFKDNTIYVEKSFTDGIETDTKTSTSKALIDLPIEAYDYFKRQQLKTGLKQYVFYSNKNKIIKNSSVLKYALSKMLKNINITNRSIYQTRHTFASLKLSFGERLEWVSYMLRHSTTSITTTYYYKYMKKRNEKRVVIDFKTQNKHTS